MPRGRPRPALPRLLEIKVQVTERARRYEAVGVGVDCVAKVAPDLPNEASRFIVIIGKPQHLYCACVVDHCAAERLDQLLQIAIAGMIAAIPRRSTGRTM